MKKIIFSALVIILCLTAALSVSAAGNKITFDESTGLSVYKEQYVIGAPITAKAEDITKRAASADTFVADKNNGTVSPDSAAVFTGTKVRASKFGVVTDELLLVIKGDLDGNGKVQSNDYLKIKKHFAGSELNGIELVAADVNNDDSIKSSDYLSVKKYFQGKYDLYPALGPVAGPRPEPTENPNSLGDSVEYANIVKNSVQARFSDGDNRRQYIMSNPQIVIYQGLTEDGKKNAQLVTNPDGGVYLEDTLDAYLRLDGEENRYLKDSISSANNVPNVVSTRIGYYFYENHIRNLYFKGLPHLLDITYNMLPDKTTVENRFVVKNTAKTEYTIGSEVKVAKSRVASLEIADKNGMHTSVNGLDSASITYLAFDIKEAGVIAFIVPEGAAYQNVLVRDDGTNYVINFEAALSNLEMDQEISLCYRIYADETHSFAGAREASYTERNRATVTVGETVNKSASAEGYSHKYGMEQLKGTIRYGAFGNAYKNPNVLFLSNTTIQNDDHERVVWVYWHTTHGGLECSALMDENGKYIAVPTEVCKNFKGEYEDRLYDPEDAAYGDCIYPIYLKASKTEKMKTSLFLQNWGKFPCQQISSIQFFSTYYHMSTGATETTCIAPMGTYWKDGLLFPDFRGASGFLWASQPQHWCSGYMYFFHIVDGALNACYPEYTGSKILSEGPSYGEMKYSYVADDGSYKYTITHLEHPQTDESRNYQVMEVEFLKDTTIRQASQKLQLFSNQNVNAGFKKLAYSDLDGNEVVKDINIGSDSITGQMPKDGSFFALYNTTNVETENFGVVMKKCTITQDGAEWDGNLCFTLTSKTDASSGRNITTVYFSPYAKTLNFKAGDKIKLEFILVPFGQNDQDNYDNIKNVYKDSVLEPMKVVATKGTVCEHPYMAVLNADAGKAEFTLSGSANNNAIRINGFAKDTKPVIEELVEGTWQEYMSASENGYDGYTAFYNEDGTYGFSWVVDMGTGASRTFRVAQ